MAKADRERIWFYITRKWYTGSFPKFYDPEKFPSTKILENNFELIRDEIIGLYRSENDVLKPNFSPYKYVEDGWRTLDVVSYLLRYKKHENKIPRTMHVLSQIPDIVTVQISVLKPGARVRAHFGDCSGLVRSHLGLKIPGHLPDIGIRIGGYARDWEQGKVMCFCDAHRHYVWNNTTQDRIVLLIDTVHPDFKEKKLYICAGMLAAGVLKIIVAKLPFTQKAPDWVVKVIHNLGIAIIIPLLYIQKVFDLAYGDIFNRVKYRLL